MTTHLAPRRRRLGVAAVAAGLAITASLLTVGASPAGALATVNVDPGGTDSVTCGAVGDECATIGQGVTNVDPGGTVNVAAGTYDERVVITKALSLVGVGPTTIIGDGTLNAGGPGQVTIAAPTGDVRVADLTIDGAGGSAGSSSGIYVDSPSTVGATNTIDNVDVLGLGLGGNDNGLYCEGSAADLVVEDSSFTDHHNNPVLIETCTGSVTVTGNTITRLAGTTGSAMFVMNHSGFVPTGDHLVSGNTITGGALSYFSAFTGASLGQFLDVAITNNVVSGTPGNGISVTNGSSVVDGLNGTYASVAITGNTLTGTAAGNGVNVAGLVTGATIEGNTITDYANGIATAASLAGHLPTGTAAVANRIVDNTVGATAGAGTALDAEDNWWGCNAGPADAACDSVTAGVDADPWLVFGIAAVPTSVTTNTNSAVTANLLTNSDGATAPGTFPNGANVTFATTLGSVTPAADPLTARLADTTFVSPTAGTATVSATLDSQTVSTTITVTAPVVPGRTVTRVFGADRIATAIAASQEAWDAASTDDVVLARSDNFPDALVGVPLAHAGDGPLLLTGPTLLDARVQTEIARVLRPGGTVHVLGGTDALAPAVQTALIAAGYDVERYAGADRYATALLVATALGSPDIAFVATGLNFPDALAAGAAAAAEGGAVVLTNGETVPAAVATYLAGTTETIAVGGPASRALPTAEPIVGADRYATAVALARAFFPTFDAAGLATGEKFPDALAGGAHIAHYGGPLLLTPPTTLDPGVATLLGEHPDATVYLYGGTEALSAAVEAAVVAL